jgi:hypothetical protein
MLPRELRVTRGLEHAGGPAGGAGGASARAAAVGDRARMSLRGCSRPRPVFPWQPYFLLAALYAGRY